MPSMVTCNVCKNISIKFENSFYPNHSWHKSSRKTSDAVKPAGWGHFWQANYIVIVIQ